MTHLACCYSCGGGGGGSPVAGNLVNSRLAELAAVSPSVYAVVRVVPVLCLVHDTQGQPAAVARAHRRNYGTEGSYKKREAAPLGTDHRI